MTYNVFGETLNLNQSINQYLIRGGHAGATVAQTSIQPVTYLSIRH